MPLVAGMWPEHPGYRRSRHTASRNRHSVSEIQYRRGRNLTPGEYKLTGRL